MSNTQIEQTISELSDRLCNIQDEIMELDKDRKKYLMSGDLDDDDRLDLEVICARIDELVVEYGRLESLSAELKEIETRLTQIKKEVQIARSNAARFYDDLIEVSIQYEVIDNLMLEEQRLLDHVKNQMSPQPAHK